MDPLLWLVVGLLIVSGYLPRRLWRAWKYCFQRPPSWRKGSGDVLSASSAESKAYLLKQEDLHAAGSFSKALKCPENRDRIYRMLKNRSRFDRLLDELLPICGEWRAKMHLNRRRYRKTKTIEN
jgi:hypothetical protein